VIEVSAELNTASDAESGAIPPMDSIDWECFRIEAGMGGVSPEAAAIAMDEANRLFVEPDATLQDVQVAGRGILALLRYELPLS